MKLQAIAESIKSPRDRFHPVLVDNKERLQSARTRLGVINTLKDLFPGVKFRMFGGPGRAKYNPRTDTIDVFNNSKLMTSKNVRNNWDDFLANMSDLLTHEHIHQEQNTRKGEVAPQPTDSPSKKETQEVERQMMDLKDLHDGWVQRNLPEKAAEVQHQITKLVTKARKKGILMRGTHADYLSSRSEITPHAETIANAAVSRFKKQGYSNDEAKSLAVSEIKTNPGGLSIPELDSYLTHVGTGNKTSNQLFKQITRYIEQM